MDTVLVVDDEAKIVDLIKTYLESASYKVFTAKNGQEALALLGAHDVSIALLDLMLPDMSGEEICRQIRKKSDIPVIMITARADEESIINGLNIGADDYITKPFSPRQLVARVAAALRRSRDEGRSIHWFKDLSVDMDRKAIWLKGVSVPLTPNEFKILSLLVSRPNKIFTREEIIVRIKTDSFDGFDRSIDSHIKNIRQKIEDDSKNPEYIVTVYGMGYRMGRA